VYFGAARGQLSLKNSNSRVYRNKVIIQINNCGLILPAGFELKQSQSAALLTHPRKFPQEDLTTVPLKLITCPSHCVPNYYIDHK